MKRKIALPLVAALVAGFAVAVVAPASSAQAATVSYEAESATRTGGASLSSVAAASGGSVVTGVGNGGKVTFTVTAAAAGAHAVTLAYFSGTAKTATISINGGAPVAVSAPAGNATSFASYKGATVTLAAGSNTIEVANAAGSAPDLDRLLVAPGTFLDESGAAYDSSITGTLERPAVVDYTQRQTSKMFLARPAGPGVDVIVTFEQALERIRVSSLLDHNMPKTVYLVGWQYQGHDDKYPAFATVNDALKRPQDATALDSLKWLMQEAKQYNTIVSLHINMTDAYQDSPLWDTYRNQYDVIARETNGNPKSIGTYNGETAYQINWTREWESGLAKKRIDDLVAMLDLNEVGTVHVDAFIPRADPFHGTTLAQEEEAQRKIFRYWRDLGIDVTSEFTQSLGLQPMVWWYGFADDKTAGYFASKSPSLLAGGQFNPNLIPGGTAGANALAFQFGESAQHEGNWYSSQWEGGYVKDWATKTLPFFFLNAHTRGANSSGVQNYSGGVVANSNTSTVTENGRVLRSGNDVLMPASWVTGHRELVAYSEVGYTNRSWTLPSSWSDVALVDTYRVTAGGYVPAAQNIAVNSSAISLTVAAGSAVIVVPNGTSVTLGHEPGDLAWGKTTTASSTVSGSSTANAVDSDPDTGWVANGGTFPQWLQVDLGSVTALGRVKQLFWETDGTTFQYKIEGSTNGSAWTVLADRTSGVTGNQRDDAVTGSYRYVRMTVTGMNNAHWANSLSFQVFAPTNLAVGAAVSASSGVDAGNATDANLTTGWTASGGTFPQWIQVDFGSNKSVVRATQKFWEDDGTVFKYKIEGSTNGTTWTTLADRTGGVTGNFRDEAITGSYRYVRLTITGMNLSHYANSLEFAVYGS